MICAIAICSNIQKKTKLLVLFVGYRRKKNYRSHNDQEKPCGIILTQSRSHDLSLIDRVLSAACGQLHNMPQPLKRSTILVASKNF